MFAVCSRFEEFDDTKKTKKMTASQQRKRSHFHYLGGSVSLQAERERRMELEREQAVKQAASATDEAGN